MSINCAVNVILNDGQHLAELAPVVMSSFSQLRKAEDTELPTQLNWINNSSILAAFSTKPSKKNTFRCRACWIKYIAYEHLSDRWGFNLITGLKLDSF